MRGNLLTAVMQAELEKMLAEGFSKSPITASTLHARLTKKGLIKGSLSTFSTTQRKLLIEEYRKKQISQADLDEEKRKDLLSHKRRVAIKDPAKSSQSCISCEESRRQLAINAIKVVRIIERAEAKGIDTDKLFADLVIKQESSDADACDANDVNKDQ